MDVTFRRRRTELCGCLCGIVLFSAGAAFSISTALTDPRIKNRLSSVAFPGGVLLVMAALSIWVVLEILRSRLTIQGERVVLEGVLRRREINLAEVTEARWYSPVCRLMLRSESERVFIRFDHYEKEANEQIIDHIRAMLRPEIQTGWNLFAYKRAKFKDRLLRRKAGPGEILIRRSRYDRLLAPFLLLTILVGVATWWILGTPGGLGGSLIVLLMWGMMRFSVPADGEIAEAITLPTGSDTRRSDFFLVLWVVAGIAVFCGYRFFGAWVGRSDVFIVIQVFCVLGLMFECHRLERERSQKDQEAADLFAKERGEAVVDPWLSE